jgi:predicted RNA methylase
MLQIQLDRKAREKAERLRTLADNLGPKIDYYLKPSIASQRPTARRSRIATSMREEGKRLQEIQGWLYGMVGALDRDELPEVLDRITNRSQLELLQRVARWESGDLNDRYGIDVIFSPRNDRFKDERDKLVSLGLNRPGRVRSALAFLDGISTAPTVNPYEERIEELERSLVGRQIPGFFPTPAELARRVAEEAGIEEGDRVLEPGAGIGSLAIAARSAGGIVDCVEIRSELADILALKGFAVRRADFLSLDPEPVYDRVILNPPFEKGIETAHIRHAYRWLRSGGRLVSIASNAVTFRATEPYKSFQSWLEEVGASVEPLPERSFVTAFRPTAVATVLITIDR